MKLHILFVRHGESVDNVKGLYAGTRDSLLTVHGTIQASRLSARLSSCEWTQRHGPVSVVFSSPLQRATLTAAAIVAGSTTAPVMSNEVLRERDYGLLEGRSYRVRGSGDVAVADVAESTASMQARADEFVHSVLDVYIQAATADCTDAHAAASETVVVVSHGVFIKVLARTLRARFLPWTLGSSSVTDDGGPSLKNTAFMHFCLDTQHDLLSVVSVADEAHLSGLKKTGGGIGSATFDARQKTLDGFFQKKQNK